MTKKLRFLAGMQALATRLFLFQKHLLTLAVALSALTAGTVQGQSIYEPYSIGTLAGLALNFGTENNTGSLARFNEPWGLAVDGSDNVYVADTLNHTIRKITPGGVVTTLAGVAGSSGFNDGAAGTALFNRPTGVAVNSAGTVVYVADYNNHLIRQISGGTVSTLAGSAGVFGTDDGTGTAAQFRNPFGVALNNAGTVVFVADQNNQTIRMITVPGGVVTIFAGSPNASGSTDDPANNLNARFNTPRGIAVDSNGNVYVADAGNLIVRKIAASGGVSTLAGTVFTPGFTDGPGNVALFSILEAMSPFGGPCGVAVDNNFNVYVTDQGNHTIRKITPGDSANNSVTTLAGLAGSSGSADGIGSAARFNYPAGVAVNSAGRLYVADTVNHTIRTNTACLQMTCATNKTVVCGSAWDFDAPTNIVAICCTDYSVAFTTVTNGFCPLAITRTWVVSDVCGNTNTCSQTVTVAVPLAFFPGTINTPKISTYASPYGNGNITLTVSGNANNDPQLWNSKFPTLFPGANNAWANPAQAIRVIGGGTFQLTVDLTAYNNLSPSFVLGFYNIQDSLNPGGYTIAAFNSSGVISPPFNWNLIGNEDDSLHLGASAHMLLDPNGTFMAPPYQAGSGSDAAFWNQIPAATATIVISANLPSTDDGVVLYFAEPASPVLTCASNKTVECGTVWEFDAPTAFDGCGGTNVTLSILSTVTNGVNPMVIIQTWQATDACSNSVTCSQTVTVNNLPPPTLICPENITTNICGTNVVVNFADPIVTDGALQGCVPASGSLFPVGTTTVRCIATNACSTNICTFDVTVTQTPEMTITCPESITMTIISGNSVVVNFEKPIVTGGVLLSCVPATGSAFPVGTTTVTCTAFNACSTNICTFTVTVNLCDHPGPNLVANGSFETTSPVVGPNSFNASLNPTTGVPGWTTATSQSFEIWANIVQSIPASNGRNQLEINAQSSDQTVTQVISGLSTNCETIFCFDYTGRFGLADGTPNNDFTVTISSGGISSSVALNPAQFAVGGWLTFCTNFIPAASTVTISFRGQPHAAITGGAHIDNVSLIQCCDCVEAPTNMVLWLPFDEASGTLSANLVTGGNDGTQVNSPIVTSGLVANSLSFDGTNQYVEVPSYDAINFGTGDFSIDAWVRRATDDTGTLARSIVDKRDTPVPTELQGYFLFLAIGGGQLVFQLADGNNWQNYNSGLTVPNDGQWHHVAVTVDRDNPNGIVFYLDGVAGTGLYNPMLIPGSVSTPLPLRVGAIFNNAYYFNGSIDEVELFSRVLATNEIAMLFNAGSAGKCKTYCDIPLVVQCAINKTVDCGADLRFDLPTATGTDVTITSTGFVTNGVCPESITQSWLITDACGNSNTCSQTITLLDAEPPVLACATNKTVNCGTVWDFDTPAARDSCSGTNVAVTILSTITNGISPMVITQTWLATDACGNTNTCSQTVTVIEGAPLAITCPADIVVDCRDGSGAFVAYSVPRATNTCCPGPVTVTCNPPPGLFPIGVTPVTCTALDSCGNSVQCSFNVIVRGHGPAEWSWAKRAGGDLIDSGNAVAVDDEGNVFVTGAYTSAMNFPASGVTLSGFGGTDIFLAKYNPQGGFIWAVRAGGTGPDAGYGVAVDSQGNAYVTGAFTGTANFGSSTLAAVGGRDIFVAKYDPNGAFVCATQAGDKGDDFGFGIVVAGNDHVFVTGRWEINGAAQAFVMKVSGVSCSILGTVLSTGGSAVGRAIAVDAADDVYVTGGYSGATSFGANTVVAPAGFNRIFVAKFNGTPSVPICAWAKHSSGGSASGQHDATGIAVSGNQCFVTGYFSGQADFGGSIIVSNAKANGLYDYLIAKFDLLGMPVWAIKGGGDLNADEETRGIAVDPAGNPCVTGFLRPGAINNQVNDGPTVLVASYSSAAGVLRWTRNAIDGTAGPIPNAPEDVGLGIAVDRAGCVHVTGAFTEDLEFPPAGQPVATLNSNPANARDMFVAKMCPTCCVEAPTNMVLWLPFDEASGTLSANLVAGGNDGTQVNSPIVTSGFVFNSLSFNGTNQYVEVPSYDAINFGTNDFSIDAWIRRVTDGTDNSFRFIVDKRDEPGTAPFSVRGYGLFLRDGILGFHLADGTFDNYNSGLTVPNDGRWHHVAVTVDRDKTTGIVFYLNGVAGAQLSDPMLHPGSVSTLLPLHVGLLISNQAKYFFGGSIDEVELFSRVLATNEIAMLFNAGSAGKCKTYCAIPLLVNCATNKTVQCGTDWRFDLPTATSCCSTNVTIRSTGIVTNGVCPQVITQRWLITDDCGHTAECSQTVTVVDTTAPVLTCSNPTVTVFSAGTTNDDFAGPEPAFPSAGLLLRLQADEVSSFKGFDDCAIDTFFAHTFTNLPPCITQATLHVRFRSCSSSLDVNDIFSLNFTAPSGVLVPPGWGRYLGDGNAAPGLFNVSWGAGSTHDVVLDLSQLPNADGSTTDLMAALNAQGFLDLVLQDDTSIDFAVLTVTSCCATDTKTVECGTDWTFDVPTVTASCSGTNVTLTVLSTETNGVCPLVITRTWLARDLCGNTNTFSQTVTVEDTTPPILTCATNKTVICGTAWTFDVPTASDRCSGTNVTITILSTVTNTTAIACQTAITRTWQATDDCGHTAECRQTVTVADCLASCTPRTYTLDADFDEGFSVNLNHTNVHDQLQVNAKTSPFLYVWIAASARGTVVKIDSATGTILGEYLSAPDGRGRDPSRTTVDKYGNCWVGNRAESASGKGSVTRYAIVIGGTRVNAAGNPDLNGQYLKPPFLYNSGAVDRDFDGLIKTSRGSGDILSWSNGGGFDNNGGVSTADDEAIITYVRTAGTGARSLAVDANNDLWVGGNDNRAHEKYSGVTGQTQTGDPLLNPTAIPGTLFNIGIGGYGAVIDGNGIVWSSQGPFAGGGLLRLAPTPLTGLNLGVAKGDYGLSMDTCTGKIWHTTFAGSATPQTNGAVGSVYVRDAAGVVTGGPYGHGFQYAQGVCVDQSSNVFIAHSVALSSTNVGHLRTDGTFVGNIPLVWGTINGVGPTGVAVDNSGKIWASCRDSHNVMRIDPNAGPLGGGNFPVGAVDLAVDLNAFAYTPPPGTIANASPYNYSDQTGFNLFGATSPGGWWTVIRDGSMNGMDWGTVSWHSSEPAGTGIQVEVRADNNVLALPSKPWTQVSSGESFCGSDITGRYLEVRVSLSKTNACAISPALLDLTVDCCIKSSCAPPNHPPTAERCPGPFSFPNRTAPVTVTMGATFTDPDGDPLTVTWREGNNRPYQTDSVPAGAPAATSAALSFTHTFPPGNHVIVVAVTDGFGNRDVCDVIVKVGDHDRPMIAVPAGVSVAAFTGVIPNFIAEPIAVDDNTPTEQIVLTQTPRSGLVVSQGVHVVEITARDLAGNVSTGQTYFAVNPVVKITSPAKYDTFTAPATITVSTTIASNVTGVASVRLLNGGVVVGADNTAPYSFVLNNLPPGAYLLTLQAESANNLLSISDSVIISVSGEDGASPICVPALITRVGYAGNVFTLSFQSIPGFTYAVEYKNTLNDPSWIALQSVLATGSLTTVQDSLAAGRSRFYRVVCQGAPPSVPLTPFEPPQAPPAQPGDASGCSAAARDNLLPYLFSGEFHHEATDLVIKGRGMDFVWARKYRSKVGRNTAQGNGWDFSYNIQVAPNGRDYDVHDGNGRMDTYREKPDGTYGADQLFCEGSVANAVFTLVFPDNGTWKFLPFNGSASQGKIGSITDRNGNALTFAYSAGGVLTEIVDTLGRKIQVGYNADGFVSSISDFANRQVTYSYYRNDDAGGSFGDLKSVTSPAITGTPNGNDFADGKTVTYTYSKGIADDLRNHKLLTITDAKGQTWLSNTYAATDKVDDFNYGRLMSQVRGYSNEVLTFFYKSQPPLAANQFAVTKAIVNDRMGNVSEHLFDAMNRSVRLRQFTGRAVPGVTTTETQNRPTGKLRAADPEFFETLQEWNVDSRPTRIVFPNGNSVENTYELALNPNVSRRFRGNLRARTSLPGPLGGDPAAINETFVYDTTFGGCCGFNFVTQATDGLGKTTYHSYDSRGNRTNTIHNLPSVSESFEYNEFGQGTAHVLPDNGSSHRRRDQMDYYRDGPQRGYLQRQIQDVGGLSLTTTFEYDSVGNPVRQIDPRGKDTLYAVNALNQVVRETSREVTDRSGIRYRRDLFYDANNNLARVDVQNLDEAGLASANNPVFTTAYEYDALNMPTRTSQEVDVGHNIVTEYDYDLNQNRTLIRHGEASAGRDQNNVERTVFDERNLPLTVARGQGAGQSTTQTDYDGNRNLVRTAQGIEDGSRITHHVFDGYGRRTATVDAMGNMQTFRFDANGNLVSERTDGELIDSPGSARNVRLAEMSYSYDAMNRKTETVAAYFDTATGQPIGKGQSVSQTIYSGASQVIQDIDGDGHATTTAYDTANRRRTVTDPKGNITTYTYDAGNRVIQISEVHKSDLGSPDQTFLTTLSYDNLDRLIQSVDNTGNTNRWAYDSRNNRGLEIDGRGNVTRHAFDGLNRLIQFTRELTDTGLGSGRIIDGIVMGQTWDDNSRLTSQTDDNANTTSFVYDSLNRPVRTVFADETSNSVIYDVHDNAVSMTDANGSVTTINYDLLNRTTDKSVARAAGVLGTTFESYQYDGLSRVVRAGNDDSVVMRGYNSLSLATTETQQVLPGGPVRTVACAYDNVGNQVSCTYPGGRVATSAYDSLHRKQTITDSLGGLAGYSYFGPGRVQRREQGNGTRTDNGYDGLLRPTSTLHTRIADGAIIDSRSYVWDAGHNKTAATDLLPRAQDARSYGYDSDGRLVRSAKAVVGPVIDYTLDGVGNRRQVSGGAQPGTYFLSAAVPPADAPVNQYTTTPFDARTYDANGNLIEAGPQRFTYDYRNRLVAAFRLNVASQYTSTLTAKYDCFGRRIEKTTPAATARYYYDDWQEIEEQNGANATVATYVWGGGIDELVEMERNGQSYFPHADDLGSVRKVTDETGNVVEQYNYGDYGEPRFFNAAGAALAGTQIGNFTLFTGRCYDPETGLYYYRTRYLDPAAGRFTTRDTIGIWGDEGNLGNGTSYVGNKPLSAVDPLGKILTYSDGICRCPWGLNSCMFQRTWYNEYGDVVETELFFDCFWAIAAPGDTFDWHASRQVTRGPGPTDPGDNFLAPTTRTEVTDRNSLAGRIPGWNLVGWLGIARLDSERLPTTARWNRTVTPPNSGANGLAGVAWVYLTESGVLIPNGVANGLAGVTAGWNLVGWLDIARRGSEWIPTTAR